VNFHNTVRLALTFITALYQYYIPSAASATFNRTEQLGDKRKHPVLRQHKRKLKGSGIFKENPSIGDQIKFSSDCINPIS
jgi:hypothetical protein